MKYYSKAFQKEDFIHSVKDAVDKASSCYTGFFLKKGMPSVTFGENCITIYFEMRKKYARNVDLPAFESLMEGFVDELTREFTKRSLPLKFWACSATEQQWAIQVQPGEL